MFIRIVFYCTAFLLLFACREDCNDSMGHAFTETDLAWFSYEPNDTLYFSDAQSGEQYYLACISKEMKIDTTRSFHDRCDRGVSYDIYHSMSIEFASSFPHFNNEPLKLIIQMRTYEGEKSLVFFEFYRSQIKYSIYVFLFNNQTESFEKAITYSYLSVISSIEEPMLINGESYSDVFTVSCSENPEVCENAFYDTIYYNRDGFLKFISSQYGYVLERVE